MTKHDDGGGIHKNYLTQDFRGAKLFVLDHNRTGDNFVAYGAPKHEYFYGQFKSEFFHEFCDTDTSLNRE